MWRTMEPLQQCNDRDGCSFPSNVHCSVTYVLQARAEVKTSVFFVHCHKNTDKEYMCHQTVLGESYETNETCTY